MDSLCGISLVIPLVEVELQTNAIIVLCTLALRNYA